MQMYMRQLQKPNGYHDEELQGYDAMDDMLMHDSRTADGLPHMAAGYADLPSDDAAAPEDEIGLDEGLLDPDEEDY